MARRPSKYPLLGRTWRISYVHEPDGDWGECRVNERTIQVNTAKLRNALIDNLWHEFGHSIFAATGLSEILAEEQEEAIMRAFEYAREDIENFIDLLGQLDD